MHNMQAAGSLGGCLMSGHSRSYCFLATGQRVVLLQMYFNISSSEKPDSCKKPGYIFSTHSDFKILWLLLSIVLPVVVLLVLTTRLQSSHCITWKTTL